MILDTNYNNSAKLKQFQSRAKTTHSNTSVSDSTRYHLVDI